jgi:hypothetical protein
VARAAQHGAATMNYDTIAAILLALVILSWISVVVLHLAI